MRETADKEPEPWKKSEKLRIKVTETTDKLFKPEDKRTELIKKRLKVHKRERHNKEVKEKLQYEAQKS